MVRFGVYILIRLYLEKLIYFYIKDNYSNLFAMRLVIAPENFWKHVIIDAFVAYYQTIIAYTELTETMAGGEEELH